MPDKKKKSGKTPGLFARLRLILGQNIGTVMFGILFVYMVVGAASYFASGTTESYQVTSGPLSRNETYTALAIREESVVKADSSGYITYYAREGSKINASGAVYGLSSTKSPESTVELSQEQLASIRSDMMSFSKGFDSSKFNATYSFKYELEGNILQYAESADSASQAPLTSEEIDAAADTQRTAASVMTLGNQTISKAGSDGIVLYSKDNYEGKTADTITADDFDQNSYHETDLKTTGQVKAGDDIYTLITDERWSLLIPLTERQAVKLADRSAIRVKFLKDNMSQSGSFSIIEIDGGKYGRISFDKGLIRYASDRFLDIELVTNTVTGLKIPLTSITTKEFYTIPASMATKDEGSNETGFTVEVTDKNGDTLTAFKNVTIYASLNADTGKTAAEGTEAEKILYYVDKNSFAEGDAIVNTKTKERYIVGDSAALEGTYCINKGYAVFRRIEILDQARCRAAGCPRPSAR